MGEIGNRDVISEYQKIDKTNSSAVISGVKTIINDTKFRNIEQMILYQVPAMKNLNNLFIDGMKSYMD